MALEAVKERPLLGIGPGLYRRATSPHNTPAAARAYGADALNRDAHNVFVEYAATVGLVGVAIFGAWLVLAARGARGELVWFVAIGGFSLLLQPLWVGLTPVLAVAFGAAARRTPASMTRVTLTTATGLVVVGAIAGALLLRGDARLLDASQSRDLADAHAATSALEPWPEPALIEARIAQRVARSDPASDAGATALRAARTAAPRDVSAPDVWNTIAEMELEFGQRERAVRAFNNALRWNPLSIRALIGLSGLADTRRRHDARKGALCPGPLGAAACPVSGNLPRGHRRDGVTRQRGRRHSAIARRTSTATMPVPIEAMTAPTIAAMAASESQLPVQPSSPHP